MPRKLFKKYLPSHDSVRGNRFIARFGPWLKHPNLWHINRHSVAGGVSVGMFAGLVPGPLQMLTAALLAVPLRVNLPVALATTLYTNPFTIGPLYILAYAIGRLLVGHDGSEMAPPPDMDWGHFLDWVGALGHWMLSLGRPFGVGLVALALLLALVGYFAVQIGWRLHVMHAWRARAQRRRERQAGP